MLTISSVLATLLLIWLWLPSLPAPAYLSREKMEYSELVGLWKSDEGTVLNLFPNRSADLGSPARKFSPEVIRKKLSNRKAYWAIRGYIGESNDLDAIYFYISEEDGHVFLWNWSGPDTIERFHLVNSP